MSEQIQGSHRSVFRYGDGKALFADVQLVLELGNDENGDGGYSILTTETYPLTNYPISLYAAATFGTAYAIERLPLVQQNTIRSIRIDLIKNHPIDTNALVVALAAANAVWNALDICVDNPPTFNSESVTFVFPVGEC